MRKDLLEIYREIAKGDAHLWRENLYKAVLQRPTHDHVPAFFYRTSVFGGNNRVFELSNVAIYVTYEHMILDRIVLSEITKYILSKNRPGSGIMFAEFSVDSLIRVFQGISERKIEEYMEEIKNLHITITHGGNSIEFPFFTSAYLDETEGIYRFTFSDPIVIMFAADDLLFYDTRQEIAQALFSYTTNNDTECEIYHAFGVILSMLDRDYPIELSYLAKKSNLIRMTIPSSMWLKKEAAKKGKLADAMKRLGIGFDSDRGVFFAEKHFKRRETLSTSIEKIRGGVEVKMTADTIRLTDRMITKAVELGINKHDIEKVFETYKKEIAKAKKKLSSTGVMSSWSAYLRKSVAPKENRGAPENIVFNDDMKKQLELYNYSEKEGAEIFTRFKAYWISRNENRQNWVSTWSNWLSNEKRRSGERQVRNQNQNTEEREWRLSRLIKQYLVQSGFSISHILKGHVSCPDFIFEHNPKKRDFLFRFADEKLQVEFLGKIEKNEPIDIHAMLGSAMPQHSNFIEVDIA